jgi:hypothetical protein
LTERHGTWSPTPTLYGYQWERCDRAGASCRAISGAAAQTYQLGAKDVGATIRVLEFAGAGGPTSTSASSAQTAVVKAAPVVDPDAARTKKWRSCTAKVNAGAARLRALTHRGSKRQRAQARLRLARYLESGHRRCMKTSGATPGRITGLQAMTGGETSIEVNFFAPGTNGNHPPPARNYLVKLSLRPIRTRRDFNLAPTLCGGDCFIPVVNVGDMVSFLITHLKTHTTYYFVIVARDNVSLRCGPRSPTVHATTGPPSPGGGNHGSRPIHPRKALPCVPTP